MNAFAEFQGRLAVGGVFDDAGGVPTSNVALWNGLGWTDTNGGVNGRVNALYVWNGDLYAGGGFSQTGDGPAENVARFDGVSWSPLELGTDFLVHSFAEYAGQLIVGAQLLAGRIGRRFRAVCGEQEVQIQRDRCAHARAVFMDPSRFFVSLAVLSTTALTLGCESTPTFGPGDDEAFEVV